jgi:hypothetical protein
LSECAVKPCGPRMQSMTQPEIQGRDSRARALALIRGPMVLVSEASTGSVIPLRLFKPDSRLTAAWYFTIAAGFLLLGISKALTGEKAWLIVLRIVIAAGFAALGYAELRPSRPGR